MKKRTLLLRKGTGGKGKEGKGMVLLLRDGKEERKRKGLKLGKTWGLAPRKKISGAATDDITKL